MHKATPQAGEEATPEEGAGATSGAGTRWAVVASPAADTSAVAISPVPRAGTLPGLTSPRGPASPRPREGTLPDLTSPAPRARTLPGLTSPAPLRRAPFTRPCTEASRTPARRMRRAVGTRDG